MRSPSRADLLGLGVGANPDAVGAGLDGDRRERLEAVPVGVRLHHDADLRRRDQGADRPDVLEEGLPRHADFDVMLRHASARIPRRLFRSRFASASRGRSRARAT